jgi:2',3'-cyclic-nucleotide 2'-phosphodiesterase (5'-nucleotidase family)
MARRSATERIPRWPRPPLASQDEEKNVQRSRLHTVVALLVAFAAGCGLVGAAAAQNLAMAGKAKSNDVSVIYFGPNGMRQDLAEAYASQGRLPAIAQLLRNGAKAADGGLVTQAPTTAGPGRYSLATGAWPGVHGAPNNTLAINGQPMQNRASAFDPGVLEAETVAQAAERGGRKVVQIEWDGGRIGQINGPTVDFRVFLSGRGVATNYVGPADNASFVASFGLQFDHPAGFAGQAPFPSAAPSDAAGWTNVPPSYSPPKEMRLRVLDFGVDKYGLNAYLFDSSNDGTTNYDRVLLSPTKDGSNAVGTLARGQWADVKVAVVGGALASKTAGMLVKVEELSGDLAKVRLFHTSVTRANASWPGWSESGFVGDFEEYVAQKFPTSTSADFAIVEAGIVSEETYAEQGLYWQKFAHPVIGYVLGKYRPDLAMVGYPTVDEFQSQFLSLTTPTLPNGSPNPAYDDVEVNGTPDGRAAARTAFLHSAYQGADATLALVQSLMPKWANSFVASDHGAAPQFLAIDASKVLVDLGLLSRPQTTNCRPATGETIGKAKACASGGTVQIYLNLAGREPAGGGLQQVPAAQEAATVAQIKAAFLALGDPNDWTGDGAPEGWTMIHRAYAKAEARYVANGPGTTADMAHPTRTGDVVVFAYPPYQFDAATPGTLVARSAFFGQEGYAPDLQDVAANVNLRGMLVAGGDAIRPKVVAGGMRTIDLAPTIAYMMGIPQPQHAQGRVRLDLLRGGDARKLVPLIHLTDFHGQLEPTTFQMDGRNVPVGGAARLATLFDEEASQLPGPRPILLASGDNVGASPPNSGLLQDRPAIDVGNAWGLVATAYGHHEFDYGLARLLMHQARANFQFLGANIVDAVTLANPPWAKGTHVIGYGDLQIGIIGIALQSTPLFVSQGATAGLAFLDEIQTIRTESERLRGMGVKVQVVLIHDGTEGGRNAVDGDAPDAWEGPVVAIAQAVQDTTVDVILAGHTHRVSNLMVGRILVAQGLNAGASYSVVQMAVFAQDVEWAGGGTRIAKNLGVPARADVQAIVDDANAQTAVLLNQIIGTQQFDIRRAPTRLFESAMGNMVADAMRLKYPGVEAAITNSGGLRQDVNCAPPSAGEQPCEITWGEMFAVLPFGNSTVILTLTGAQLEQAFLNGFAPSCNPAIATGRFPQVSGLKVTFACNGLNPVVTGMWKAPDGVGGTLVPIGPADTVRLVTNDFMYTGGDGYTVLTLGTDVLLPLDILLDVVIEYVTVNSPVGPVVEGRIVGP